MNYRQKRNLAMQDLMRSFQLDDSGCRDKFRLRMIRDLCAYGFYTHEIAEMLDVTPKTIQKVYRRYNFPDMQNFFPPRLHERQGWKGGTKLMKGYLYKRTPDHPNGTKHGNYVAVHRLVMEEKLGRYLLPTEVVDHIDGDITNNHPDNLRVFPDNATHLRVTLKGRCPEWSEDGKERTRQAVIQYHRNRSNSES